MTKYNVHIYREMRLTFDGIEADSPKEAAEIAHNMHFDDASDWSDCEGESLAALVDIQGDEEYELSEMIDFEPGRHLKTAGKLLDALNYLLEQTVDMDMKYGIGLSEGEEDARTQALAAIAEATGA